MNKGVSFHKHLYCFGVNKIVIDFLTKIYRANSLSFCIFNYVSMAGCLLNMSKYVKIEQFFTYFPYEGNCWIWVIL